DGVLDVPGERSLTVHLETDDVEVGGDVGVDLSGLSPEQSIDVPVQVLVRVAELEQPEIREALVHRCNEGVVGAVHSGERRAETASRVADEVVRAVEAHILDPFGNGPVGVGEGGPGAWKDLVFDPAHDLVGGGGRGRGVSRGGGSKKPTPPGGVGWKVADAPG